MKGSAFSRSDMFPDRLHCLPCLPPILKNIFFEHAAWVLFILLLPQKNVIMSWWLSNSKKHCLLSEELSKCGCFFPRRCFSHTVEGGTKPIQSKPTDNGWENQMCMKGCSYCSIGSVPLKKNQANPCCYSKGRRTVTEFPSFPHSSSSIWGLWTWLKQKS